MAAYAEAAAAGDQRGLERALPVGVTPLRGPRLPMPPRKRTRPEPCMSDRRDDVTSLRDLKPGHIPHCGPEQNYSETKIPVTPKKHGWWVGFFGYHQALWPRASQEDTARASVDGRVVNTSNKGGAILLFVD